MREILDQSKQTQRPDLPGHFYVIFVLLSIAAIIFWYWQIPNIKYILDQEVNQLLVPYKLLNILSVMVVYPLGTILIMFIKRKIIWSVYLANLFYLSVVGGYLLTKETIAVHSLDMTLFTFFFFVVLIGIILYLCVNGVRKAFGANPKDIGVSAAAGALLAFISIISLLIQS